MVQFLWRSSTDRCCGEGNVLATQMITTMCTYVTMGWQNCSSQGSTMGFREELLPPPPPLLILLSNGGKKNNMKMKLNEKPGHTARRMVQQGARPLVVHRVSFENYTTGRLSVVCQAGVEQIITGTTNSYNPVKARILYKIDYLCFQCLSHNTTPPYLF